MEENKCLNVLRGGTDRRAATVLEGLRLEQVVLVKNTAPSEADELILSVAEALKLRERLEIQSAFAAIQGHRERIGKYFMSVNRRKDYQFIPAHSEGRQGTNMQLAALYCFEDTTDGGEVILLNTDDESASWTSLRAHSLKIDLNGKTLSRSETARVKAMLQISLPHDLLGADDEVMKEVKSPISGARVFEVLSKPRKTYSRILERELNGYWDNIASTDFDAGEEYLRLLRELELLREPEGGLDISTLDNAHGRRVYRSGLRYTSLFKGRVVLKLTPGDLVIQNNLTWAHSCANWTPASGNRRVAAAFA